MRLDLASLLGLLLGLGAVVLGQWAEGGELVWIVQPAAAILVFGGTAGATLLSVPWSDVQLAWRSLPRIFRGSDTRIREIAAVLLDLSDTARRNGLVALEKHPRVQENTFLRHAVEHIVDGAPDQTLRDLLGTRIALRSDRELAAARVFEAAGGYAPTMGILGAVLGLMHVMRNLEDPSRLGEGIAVAFVATVYGVALANLFCLPIARKLRRLIEDDSSVHDMVIEAALGIQAGLSPRVLESRLEPYLSAAHGTDSP